VAQGDGEAQKHDIRKAPDEDYGIFGVKAKRDETPVVTAPVDRQRLYTGIGGPLSMGAKPRFKNTGGGSVNKSSAGSFKVRRRTLSK